MWVSFSVAQNSWESKKYFQQSIKKMQNYEGVCRTAPATPGLLKKCVNVYKKNNNNLSTSPNLMSSTYNIWTVPNRAYIAGTDLNLVKWII